MTAKLSPMALLQHETLVPQRYSCEVPTTCQPPSSWCKDPWPATIRDISNGGLSLTLGRRFERGSGLAIELPTEDGTSTTVLARVAHVRPYPEGGWQLGCEFVSHLSDEEVQLVLNLDSVHHASLGEQEKEPQKEHASVHGVLFQAKVAQGEVVRWYVKRLDLAGAWPLPTGKTIALRIASLLPGSAPLEMVVRACRRFGSYWIVDGALTETLSDEVMHALTSGPTLGPRPN